MLQNNNGRLTQYFDECGVMHNERIPKDGALSEAVMVRNPSLFQHYGSRFSSWGGAGLREMGRVKYVSFSMEK